MNDRIFSPYENTHLARYGVSPNRVVSDTPVEYATGIAEFCGLELSVNQHVLIPRVETEGLVELALQAVIEKSSSTTKPISIVDVGTGSGAVIISIAKHLTSSSLQYTLDASDVSSSALEVAKSNAAELVPTAQLYFTKSDLLSQYTKKFDCIVANLPYIPSQRIANLDSSVTKHEPVLALDGGDDGFVIIRRLLKQAQGHLTKTGSVILEIDHTHTVQFFEPFQKDFASITFFTDCFDTHRFVRLDLKNSDR